MIKYFCVFDNHFPQRVFDMKPSAVPFYRPPSDKRARHEDKYAISEDECTVLVADGVSEPYVGEPTDYGEGKSGGEVVSQIISDIITTSQNSVDLLQLLHQASGEIAKKHSLMGRDLTKQAVAGASVAACQIKDDQALFVTVGDSPIFWEDESGSHVFTNFTSSAAALEEAGNEFFEACKHYGAMVGATPWQLYHPFFQAKQFYRANRHVGGKYESYKPGINGGHGIVNGNPDMALCWSTQSIISLSGVRWILLVTDGMLWRDFRPENQKEVAEAFNRGGIPALLELRDARDNQPHISGHPEGSAIMIKFD